MSDSLIANYLHERRGLKTIFEENAFVCYKIVEKECFIGEMGVSFEAREKGAGRALIGRLEKIALENECNILTGTIHLNAPGATKVLRAALATGFEVVQAENQTLYIAKSLVGG